MVSGKRFGPRGYYLEIEGLTALSYVYLLIKIAGLDFSTCRQRCCFAARYFVCGHCQDIDAFTFLALFLMLLL